MAPREDPIEAEYDVFVTPALEEQIHALQYLNRPRDRPYNYNSGARPENVRTKPRSGFMELDISMQTSGNFNRYQSLKWGDALQAAKQLQNDTATYGPASGFTNPRGRQTARLQLKDKADRENEIFTGLANFDAAQDENKALISQTLGGKINPLETDSHGQPAYFIAAFRDKALYLSKVDATTQMRPQFHHVDAEDQRTRTATSRAAAAAETEVRPPPTARALQQSYKDLNDDKDKDAPERQLRKVLQDAEEEEWTRLHYIDEQENQAFETFNQCMFVESDAAKELSCADDAEVYLDSISRPMHELHKRKKRPARKKGAIEINGDEDAV